MPAQAALTIFVNPRPWEPAVRAEADAAPPAEKPQKQLLVKTWQAVESCWASFELTPRVRLQAVVKYDQKALPSPVSEFLACFSGPSGFLPKVPAGALLAAALRVDADRFITWAQTHGPPEKQSKQEEAKVIVSLLRLLGPDLGIYLKPQEGADSAQWLQWAGAIGVRPQMPPQRESLQLIQAAVQPLLGAVARSFTESASSRLTAWLLGDGLRTLGESLSLSRSAISAIGLADGRLWIAGSSGALQEAQAVAGEQSLAKSTRWTGHLSEVMRDPGHVLYVDCAAWEQLLDRHGDALVKDVLAKNTVGERRVDEATATKGLKQLRALLRLTDTFVAAVKVEDGRIAASLSVAVDPAASSAGKRTAQP
jgi:hypothetical protein